MHVTVALLRHADGRLEGMVTTESGREHPFSGTLGLLRILEDLEPEPDAPDAPDADRTPGTAR